MGVQSRSLAAAPRNRDTFFHGGTRCPIFSHPLSADDSQVATEIGSPDPTKSRRPGPRRAFTRRTRFQAALTVPEVANQTLRMCSQFFLDKIYGRVIIGYNNYCIFLIIPADAAYQARDQGPFRRMIHPCMHPAHRRERNGARQMCTAAAVYCSSCCCCTAATYCCGYCCLYCCNC